MSGNKETVIVVHLSVSLFKYLDEVEQAIVKEALMEVVGKTLGQDRVQEVIEKIVTEKKRKEKIHDLIPPPFKASFGRADTND